MNVIPARIAGVGEIVVVTPPDREGRISDEALAAAKIAGADRIFKIGGAQAVAALAYGTESVPAVDKIVGPGGVYVATAKRKVFGLVGIDMIAGPSEILVVADEYADARCVAADLLSQAEHDVHSCAVLVTTSESLARAVQQELEEQAAALPRREIVEKALAGGGKILLADSLEEAVAAANRIAPEHLELCVQDPFALLPLVKNAGSVFLGGSARRPWATISQAPTTPCPPPAPPGFPAPWGWMTSASGPAFSTIPPRLWPTRHPGSRSLPGGRDWRPTPAPCAPGRSRQRRYSHEPVFIPGGGAFGTLYPRRAAPGSAIHQAQYQ